MPLMNTAAFKKLSNNILTTRAVSVLGPRLYAAYLGSFIRHFPEILRSGNLHALDKALGQVAKRFRYRNTDVFLDCRFCDEQIQEESYAFGLAREIYIRDCYFRFHLPSTFENAKVIVDLGTNRGAFSVLRAAQADFVLCVEATEAFVPVIKHNLQSNGCSRYAIETIYIGAGGKMEGSPLPMVTMAELLQRHSLQHIDFLKMDIEGSEFTLFESAEWLEGVHALSLEVHRDFGDPNRILDTLTRHKFLCIMANENLDRVENAGQANFIYAWKRE